MVFKITIYLLHSTFIKNKCINNIFLKSDKLEYNMIHPHLFGPTLITDNNIK